MPLVLLAAMALVALLLRPVEPPFTGAAFAVDGDTLRVGTERVRLIGIDAPELEQTCTRSDGAIWACGKAARDALTALIRGAGITCAPQGRDRYGRILAKCKSGATDLAQAIVEQGLAVGEFEYLVAELAARNAGKGIWSGTFEQPKLWREQHGIGVGPS